MSKNIQVLKHNTGKLLDVVENVEIDPSVLIDCPATLPRVRLAAAACPRCPHFRGIARRSWTDDGTKLKWDIEFVIRCAHIMERVTKIIEIYEE